MFQDNIAHQKKVMTGHNSRFFLLLESANIKALYYLCVRIGAFILHFL